MPLSRCRSRTPRGADRGDFSLRSIQTGPGTERGRGVLFVLSFLRQDPGESHPAARRRGQVRQLVEQHPDFGDVALFGEWANRRVSREGLRQAA